ncbi:hypothetical protein HanHA89_Chr03g0089731 [Helianthus annuus]|nr:hypothetical protein HanHA89_Chr03g0089731 [Helianthus annuus]
MDAELERQLESSVNLKMVLRRQRNEMIKELLAEKREKQMVKKVAEKQTNKHEVATCEGLSLVRQKEEKKRSGYAQGNKSKKKKKTAEAVTKKAKITKTAKSRKRKPKTNVREPLLFSIRTRSSPRKMYECIYALTEKQRKIVRKMGFGKILSLKVDTIPGKVAHFVVDQFDPNTMEIKFGRIAIKVDEEAIHQLLGLPNSGFDLTAVTPPKENTALGKAYKKRHDNKFTIKAKKIVEKISFGEDKEGLMFKLDFIVLFINTMVECHINGLCKAGIVDLLNEDMDFSKINWCKYIVHIIKRCKKVWVPRDLSSYFRGALTILTLLYVDSVTCKGINEERTCSALEYWTSQRLQLREDMEIEQGGFGRGDLRGLFVTEEGSDSEPSEETNSENTESEETEESGPGLTDPSSLERGWYTLLLD